MKLKFKCYLNTTPSGPLVKTQRKCVHLIDLKTKPESGVDCDVNALNSRPPFDVSALVREELILTLTVDVGEHLEGNFLLTNVIKDPQLEV